MNADIRGHEHTIESGYQSSEVETSVLEDISLDTPWPVVEQFSKIVRLSGSDEERDAVDILTVHLCEFGIPYAVYEPECYISWPLAATVRVAEEGGRTFYAKTSSMSISTDGREIEGELVYIPPSKPDALDPVHTILDLGDHDVAGKIAIVEGLPLTNNVTAVAEAGAIAGIFVSPGERIHESVCTNIWGTPDLDSMKRQPTLAVTAVNNSDGMDLIRLAQDGGRVAVSTTLDTRWRKIPVLVAEIRGRVAPNEYVLLNGHLDSWHEGVGDNATGDAAMLEIARVFWNHRDQLHRSLRIAWWSGHSHGRYAGSAWYADEFAIDLANNCVAQVNCDSPGCRWADTYNHLACMSETSDLLNATIVDISGIEPQLVRPPQAGDYSFNHIGLSSFLMLSSTMSDDKRKELGYYPVGGCGGNIQWHTEADTMEVADPRILLRDMRVYAGALLRVLNSPLHPFNWQSTVREFRTTLDRYQEAAGEAFDFAPAYSALSALDSSLDQFYRRARETSVGSEKFSDYNRIQRKLGRLLIPVNYSRMAPFWRDPALKIPSLPDLVPALRLKFWRDDPHLSGIARAHLTRGQNRLVWAVSQAKETVDQVLT